MVRYLRQISRYTLIQLGLALFPKAAGAKPSKSRNLRRPRRCSQLLTVAALWFGLQAGAVSAERVPIVFYNVPNWYSSGWDYIRYSSPVTAVTTEWPIRHPQGCKSLVYEWRYNNLIQLSLGAPYYDGFWQPYYIYHNCVTGEISGPWSYGSAVRTWVWCSPQVSAYSWQGFLKTYPDGLCPADNQPQFSKMAGPCPDVCTGNPVNNAIGNKFEVQTDYEGRESAPMEFSWVYNSKPIGGAAFRNAQSLGFGRIHRYERALNIVSAPVGTATTAYALRPDGKTYAFTQLSANGAWVADADVSDSLARTPVGWAYSSRNGVIENYDASGKLLSMANRQGMSEAISYDVAGRVERVTDSFGRSLTFVYNMEGRLEALTVPGGQSISYSYDTKGNLARITYPDGTARVYHYENSSYLNALTGISLDNGTGTVTRISTFGYDAYGNAVSTEHAGTQERFILTYDSATQTTVTDATGAKEVMTYTLNLGVKKLVSKKSFSDNKTLAQVFDAKNNLTCRQDEEGRVTTYTYNTTNQKLTETTGRTGPCAAPVNTSATRTTTYQYLAPDLDLPTLIESPSVVAGQGKRTTITYSGKLPTAITQSGYTPSGSAVSRTVTLGYNASGQVTSLDGPRTDVNDVTTLSYNDCTTGGGCGQLKGVTNALGHTTTYDSYDAAGRLLSMTGPTGLVTTYQYDPRGRVRFINQGGRVTEYRYDAAGNVTYAALPGGRVLGYTYDAANYLRTVTDSAGNRIEYGYDLKGNRTSEKSYDASGTLARSLDLAYDARNRVSQVNAGGAITKQVWDAVGNLTTVTDPNTVAANGTAVTTNQYDVLNRLTRTIDLLAGNTQYGYDANDRVKSVQAPNGATTTYEVDDLGNVLKETSPDRGVTSYSYDAAGNVTSQTDARGVTVAYRYDALNRLTAADYPGTEEDVSYSYDSCGAGRLCRVVDAAGSSDYAYDAFGNVATHTRTELGVVYTTGYSHDAANRVTAITYPNGRVVSLGRDALGHVTSASMSLHSVNTTLLTAASYRPDGLVTSRSYGNGLTEQRVYNLKGELREQYLGQADTRLYGYDANGNLTGLQSLPQVGAYQYDALNRLTLDSITSSPVSSRAMSYNANGNRTVLNGAGYTYAAASNRLATTPDGSLSLDAAGNTLSDPGRSFSYNNAGHLKDAWLGATPAASYAYNAQRQRTRKLVGSEATVYHYDLAGRLLAETRADGSLIRDYLWADNTPLAQVEAGERLAYLHTDHLDTPRLATDAQARVVWRWEGAAFGDTAPSEDPDGDAVRTTINLRFPGQYYDAETGLHYNWNRYYDPKLGRYITSDPIGLEGGINTFLYAKAGPTRFSDRTGLFTPPVHIEATREATRKVCPKLAGKLPDATMRVDFQPGAQDPSQSFRHAMCSPGQSPSEGMSRTEEYIEREISKCTVQGLANALHAAQDKHSRTHQMCQVWSGTENLTTSQVLGHLVGGDIAGPGVGDATIESELILKRFKEKCPCECN